MVSNLLDPQAKTSDFWHHWGTGNHETFSETKLRDTYTCIYIHIYTFIYIYIDTYVYMCIYIAILKLNALQLVYSPFQNILHSEGLATNEPTQQVGLQATGLW